MSNKLPLPNASRTREMLNTLGKRPTPTGQGRPSPPAVPGRERLSGINRRPLRPAADDPRPFAARPPMARTTPADPQVPTPRGPIADPSKIISSEQLEAARRAKNEREDSVGPKPRVRLNRPGVPRPPALNPPANESLGDTIAAAHNALDDVLGRAERAVSAASAEVASGFQRKDTRPNQPALRRDNDGVRPDARHAESSARGGKPPVDGRYLDDLTFRERTLAVNWDRKSQVKILPEDPETDLTDLSFRERVLAVNWDRNARPQGRGIIPPSTRGESAEIPASVIDQASASVDAFFGAIDW